MWYDPAKPDGVPRMATATTPSLTEFDLFLRLWDKEKMTPTLARHILKLDFAPADDARMHELARKNQDGAIAPDELRELDAYVRVGVLVSTLQSRARKLLKAKIPARAAKRDG
jgi:hypothetical protein